MRAIVLLLLGGGLIWAVLTFFPRTSEVDPNEVVGGQGEVVEEPGQASVEPSAALQGGNPDAGPREASFEKPQPPADVNPGGGPGTTAGQGSTGGFTLGAGDADLVEIGSLLLHRGSAEVDDWLTLSDGLLGDDLGHAVGAFALAVEGDRGAARERAKQIGSFEELNGRVRWLLQRAAGGDVEAAWPANVTGGDPLERAMVMRLRVAESQVLLGRKGHVQAAAHLSRVLVDELNSPWAADRVALEAWSKLLRSAQVRHRWNPQGDWPYVEMAVQPGDSLTAIRKRYLAQYPDRRICTGLIQKANGMSSDLLHPDTLLRVPTEEVTLLCDLDAHWLLYMIGGEVVESWAVGIGREGEETITGEFTIGEKIFEPTWFRGDGPPIFYGEEGNPLGTRYMTWFREGIKTHFGFHGTWEPASIGGNESDGCIRMLNEHAELLFEITPVGTRFWVQP